MQIYLYSSYFDVDTPSMTGRPQQQVLFIYTFVLASSSGLRGHKRTYLTILESADHALFKIVRYVLLRPLRPELDAKTKTCLPAKTRFCHLDEHAKEACLEPVGRATARRHSSHCVRRT
jgi:hypothetical protein